MNQDNTTTFLSTREAASLIGYTHDYVSRLCRTGKLDAKQTGNSWLISLSALESFAKSHALALNEYRESLANERRNNREVFKRTISQSPDLGAGNERSFLPNLSRPSKSGSVLKDESPVVLKKSSPRLVALPVLAGLLLIVGALTFVSYNVDVDNGSTTGGHTAGAVTLSDSNSLLEQIYGGVQNVFYAIGETILALLSPNVVYVSEGTIVSSTSPSVALVETHPSITNVSNYYTTHTAPVQYVQSDVSLAYVQQAIDNLRRDLSRRPSGGSSSSSGLSDITGESIEDLADVASMATAFGDLLYWDGSIWNNIATSSLGISGGSGSPGGATTQVQYNDTGSFAGNAAFTFDSASGRLTVTNASTTAFSSSYASSTNAFFGTLGVNGETFTDLTGAGLSNVGGALTLNATGDWTGTFDGQEGTYYLARANHTGTQLASTISDFSSTARGLISSSATGLTYTSGTGVFSLTGGYTIPLSASTTEWDTAYSWGDHATAGYENALTFTYPLTRAVNAISLAFGTTTANSWSQQQTFTGIFATNASSTNATTTSLGINAETFTDLTGSGLSNVGGALTLNATGDWTGTFDGQEGSYYLARANHTGTQLASTISDFASTARGLFSSTFPIAYNSGTGAFTFNGLSTSTSAVVGNIPYFSGANTFANVATTSATLGFGLSYSGTLGSLIGGSAGSLTIATSSLYTGTTGQVPYFSNTNTITATSSLFISASGNVGIGTTTPFSKLHLFQGESGATPYAFNGDDFVIEGSGSTGMSILIPDGSDFGGFFFGRTSSSNAAGLSYAASTDDLTFTADGAARASLSDAQFYLFGATNTLIRVTDGSSGDLRTGIASGIPYIGSANAGSFQLYSSNTAKVTINSSGNVGVGTTTPYGKLSIEGAGNTSRDFTDSGNMGAALILKDTAGAANNGGQILFGASTGLFAGIKGVHLNGTGPAGALAFQTRSTSGNILERMTIDYNGNVGIGTTSPTGNLEVWGPTYSNFRIGANNTVGFSLLDWTDGNQFFDFNGSLSFRDGIDGSGNTSPLTLQNGGNVGIGTTTSLGRLEVYDDAVQSVGSHFKFKAGSSSGSNTATVFDIETARGDNAAGYALLNISNSAGSKLFIDGAGKVGIGTTTPGRRLSVTDTASQLLTGYDATRYTLFGTDSVGDLTITPQGSDIFSNDSNLWICAGGSCPSGSISGTGNIIAETAIGVGSSTPWAGLSVVSGKAIVVGENVLATSTSMSVDWRNGNQQLVRIGTAGTTISFSGYIPGQRLALTVCNPGATAGAITWGTRVYWAGGSTPTQTTTANKCELWSFFSTSGTTTPIIMGAQTTF